MTDVEFTRLLSELSETAKVLNRESDSINDLITRFEETLRKINLGLEVWLTSDPLESTTWTEEDETGRKTDEGSTDIELGFTKIGDAWSLATRHATYRKVWESFGVSWDLLGEPRAERLLNASRELRIEALKYFPKLAAQMKAEGESALKAIEEAKKFVK